MVDPGEGPPCPLFLNQTEAQRAKKNCFWNWPPLRPPLTEGLDLPLLFNAIHVLNETMMATYNRWYFVWNMYCKFQLLNPINTRLWVVSLLLRVECDMWLFEGCFTGTSASEKRDCLGFIRTGVCKTPCSWLCCLNTHIRTVSHSLADFREKNCSLSTLIPIMTLASVNYNPTCNMLLISNILWTWAYDNTQKLLIVCSFILYSRIGTLGGF